MVGIKFSQRMLLKSNWQFLPQIEEKLEREIHKKHFMGKDLTELVSDYKSEDFYIKMKQRIMDELDYNPLFERAFTYGSYATTTTTSTTLPSEVIVGESVLKDNLEELIEEASNIEDLLTLLINLVKKTISPTLKAAVIMFIINFMVILTYDIVKPKLGPRLNKISPTDDQSITKTVEETINETEIEKDYLINLRLVTAQRLNVRAEPTSSSLIVALLTRNNLVRVIEKQGRWYLVEYKSESKDILIKGWVYGRYLRKIITD